MSFLVGTLLLAIVTAVACALPGVFVVLRKNSMLVDAISHAILPGIILGYFFTRDFNSPLLILGASLAGLAVVLGSEYLSRTGLITGDAPQGLIFPALFSVGVIMVTLNFGDVHLDTHAVLVGDLNLAAFEPLIIGGLSVGPTYLYVMLAVLAVNTAFLTLAHKQMKATTFDPQFAKSIGLRTTVINTSFMFLVSLTVTAAFNAAGAILVIALMVIPAATAYLLTNRLPRMIAYTVAVAVVGAVAGFGVAYSLDAATSAGMSVFYGFLFAAALAFVRLRERRQRRRLVAQSRSMSPVTGDTQTALVAESPSETSEALVGRTVSASE
ncbi:MAG: metal ABC transporter permease [Arachnia sp.]